MGNYSLTMHILKFLYWVLKSIWLGNKNISTKYTPHLKTIAKNHVS